MKINKHIQDIMEWNGIKMTDKKVFRDKYENGYIDEYEMTFEELLNATGINDAVLYWNDINPYSEENDLENSVKYGLIDNVILEEMLEDGMINKEEYEKYIGGTRNERL